MLEPATCMTILGSSINQANLASPEQPDSRVDHEYRCEHPVRAPYLGWTTNTMYLLRDRWRGLVQLDADNRLRRE